MKNFLKGFVVAFSMYTKIPMPYIKWEETGLRYALCFFPLTGAVTGLLVTGLYLLMSEYGFGSFFIAGVITVIPILITGGIHMDGYMDTRDAMSSYRTGEKRLEILKDSHIGAFAAMSAVCYFVLYFAAATELDTKRELFMLAPCFVISRAMSALSFVTLKSARRDGLQKTFSDAMQKRAVLVSSLLYVAAALVFCGLTDGKGMGVLFCAVLVLYVYYSHFSQKNFGGITGDLAGYYLQIQELVYLLLIVVMK